MSRRERAGTPVTESVRSYWNSHPVDGNASDFETRSRYVREKEPWLEQELKELYELPRPLLEIGAGQGNFFVPLSRRGPGCVGVDLSDNSLRSIVREVASPACLSVADARSLPFRSACFESAISYGVLHHSPDLGQSFREIHRVLRPGGAFRFMLYARRSPKGIAVATIRAAFRARDGWSIPVPALRGGTALSELLLCPVLDLYTEGEIRDLLKGFACTRLIRVHFGLHHLAYLLWGRRSPALMKLDEFLGRTMGFYIVGTAIKTA